VQVYSVDAQTVRTIYATLASVFPHVDTWVTEEPDMMLVASKKPIRFDTAALKGRIKQEPYKTALENVWLTDDVEGFLARFVARSTLAKAIAESEGDALNTDDQTLVEFGFARMAASQHKLFNVNDLRQTSLQRREDRPPADGVDWSKLLQRRLSMLTAQQAALPTPPADAPEAVRRRARAFSRWLGDDRAGALADFGAHPPEDPIERLLVAECRADAGDESVLALIESLRAQHPIEADAFAARLHLRKQRLAEAATSLEKALTAYRTNPWPLPFIMEDAVSLSLELAQRDRALGERFFQLLGPRFSVHAVDGKRRSVRLQLLRQLDFDRLCMDEIALDEPWVPWRREFLTMRVRCYEVHQDPRADRARSELSELVAAEPIPFSTGL
jgi:hypothetical protein